jgi:hypothetical protein
MSSGYDWREDMDIIEACEEVWDCADGCCTNIMPRHNDEAIRLAAHIEALEADLDTANARADEWEAVAGIVAREGGESAVRLLEALKAGPPSPLHPAAREAVRR